MLSINAIKMYEELLDRRDELEERLEEAKRFGTRIGIEKTLCTLQGLHEAIMIVERYLR